jgi:hypothetical protein
MSMTTDAYPDTRRDALLADLETLDTDDDAWTWLDADPDVAWTTQPEHLEDGEHLPYHARLRDILLEAGWEPCYHGDARLHYNIKTDGMEANRAFNDRVGLESEGTQARIEEALYEPYNMAWDDLQIWWYDNLPDFLTEIGYPPNSENPSGFQRTVFQCGRSGGYANTSRMEKQRDGAAMVRLAQFLERARAYFNSADYGADLAERAILQDDDEQTQLLASPRPDRIEA